MGIDEIFGNCAEMDISFIGSEVGAFIEPEDAAQRYFNRIDRGTNKIEGHLVSVSQLRAFLDAIDSVNHADKIEFVRIWKGTSTEYGKCPSNAAHRFFLEDLVLVPVFSNGKDVHANDVSQDPELSKAKILSSLRPCPKWCGSRESFNNQYLFDRFQDAPTTNNPHVGIDPYRNYIQC